MFRQNDIYGIYAALDRWICDESEMKINERKESDKNVQRKTKRGSASVAGKQS